MAMSEIAGSSSKTISNNNKSVDTIKNTNSFVYGRDESGGAVKKSASNSSLGTRART